MGFRAEEKSLKIRSKCELALKHFKQSALRAEYRAQIGNVSKYDTGSFYAIEAPLEYTASTTHVISSTAFGSDPTAELGASGETGGFAPPSHYADRSSLAYDKIYDASGISNLRGFLQPMTLREYCTTKSLNQTAARTFQQCWKTHAYYTSQNQVLFDLTSRQPNNEFSAYADKIVPVITWYYTDREGDRIKGNQQIRISKWYTTNKYKTKTYKEEHIPFGGGTQRTWRVSSFTTSDTVYCSICPPYVSSVNETYSDEVSYGANLNGAVYSTWGQNDTSPNVIVSVDTSHYYTMLRVGWNDTDKVSTAYKFYPVTTGAPFVNVGVTYENYFDYGETIPVYDSVEDIIALFADYGVTVTTDFEEVINPTPTPEEIATPNPDPTDREIPNFPDNTTDYTPVEPAYITPSTFGQSCVYNPTTTRDFLRWVCDSTVDVGNWARLFANPADVITGINLYNLDIVAHDAAHVEAKTETNILGVTTPIPNYAILGGYNNIVDGGTLHLQAYYGNYADFTSMTYQMFVPFVGFTTLRACDVVNKTLHLYYAVDFATGSAVAFVNSDDKLIYTSPCTVAGKIPLSTSDRNSQMINNTLSVLGGLSGLLGGVASGNVGGGVGALMGGLGGLQMQTNYSNKGSLSSVNIYKLIPAFVERTRYDLFFPSNDSAYINARYQTAAGAPSTQFDTLLNCVDAGGFVQSDVVYLTSQTATETEKQQIIDLIKSGIYL